MNLIFSIVPKIAWNLSFGSLFHFIRLLFLLEYFLISREFLVITKDFLLPVVQGKRKYFLVLNKKNDLSALKELFIDKVYSVPVVDPKIIIDLGANFGESALYFHLKYPLAQIYAVEPAHDSYRRLEVLASTIPEIIPVQTAIAPHDGVIDMYIFKELAMSNSIQMREGYSEVVSVKSSTYSTFLRDYDLTRVDILKFDIEGGEDSLFEDPGVETSLCVVGEYHAHLAKTSISDFVKYFKGMGFYVTPPDTSSDKFLLTARRQDVKIVP